MTAHCTSSIDDYDFELPTELIAQRPAETRRGSRLLRVSASHARFDDHQFDALPGFVEKNDLLVFNDTRVIPARLFGKKASGGQIEVLLERIESADTALVQIRASRAPRPGQPLLVPGAELTVVERDQRFFRVRVAHGPNIAMLFQESGQIPLPPYIDREADDLDLDRYQTVYARELGAVAAPTAGLHFDEAMFGELERQGIATGFLTLHVGAGTFQPVQSETIDDHKIHTERVRVSDQLVDQILATRASGGRVIAIGTTVVRALETLAARGEIRPFDGNSDIFIKPGHEFGIVDGMLTNFHLPRSTLLVLVAAFLGRPKTLAAYHHAIQSGYRFYSYGDAMWIEK